jgi:uncharacterized membrane protein
MTGFEDIASNVALMVSFVLLTAVGIMHFRPPSKINYFYGYRTPRAMKSQAHWNFAQRYANRRMFEYGVFMLVLGLSLLAFNFEPDPKVFIGIGALLGLPFYIFISTERAIIKKFPK